MVSDKQQSWFHGSSLKLDTLKEGSSITRIEELARAFSTRPGLVSVSDDGIIKHDGKMKGKIYRIAEQVTDKDIRPHPASSMEKDWEWVINRELKLEFLYEFVPSARDVLSEEKLNQLKEIHANHLE